MTTIAAAATTMCRRCETPGVRVRSGKLLAHHTPEGKPCANRELEPLMSGETARKLRDAALDDVDEDLDVDNETEDGPWVPKREESAGAGDDLLVHVNCGVCGKELLSPKTATTMINHDGKKRGRVCKGSGQPLAPAIAEDDLTPEELANVERRKMLKARQLAKIVDGNGQLSVGERAHAAQVAQIDRDRRAAASMSQNTYLRGINGLDDDLPEGYVAKKVDERTAELPDGTRLRTTPPGQPNVGDLLPRGTLVKADYHEKRDPPLVVLEASRHDEYGLPTWSLTLVPMGAKLNEKGDARENDKSWINELVAQDGRILHFFELNKHEVFIVDAKGKKQQPKLGHDAKAPTEDAKPEEPTPRALGPRKRSHIAGAVLIDLDQIRLADHYSGIPIDEAFVESLMSLPSPEDLLEAADVVPVDGDLYELHQGRHRLEVFKRKRAAATTEAERAAWSKLDAIVHKDLSEIEKLRIAGVKNFMRRKPGLYEQARYFERLVKAGAKVVDVARDAGLSEQTARNRLKLLKLPTELAQRVGTPGDWLTTSHADVVVPAIDKFGQPAIAALQQAVIAGDAQEWQRPVEGFRARFVGQLIQKRLIAEVGTHDEIQARRYPDLAAEFDKLPKIQLGQLKYARDYYADGAAFTNLLDMWADRGAKEREEREAAARKKQSTAAAPASSKRSSAPRATPAAPPQPRGKSAEAIVDEKLEEVRATGIATGIQHAKPEVRRMVVAHSALWLADEGDVGPQDADLLARVSGLERRDATTLLARSGTAYYELLEKLAKAKDQRLEIFTAAAGALGLEREMWLPPQIMDRFFKFDEKATRKKLLTEELAAKKVAKSTPAGEPMAICAVCGTSARLRVDGTLYRHKAGGGQLLMGTEACKGVNPKKDTKDLAQFNAAAVKVSDRLARGPAKARATPKPKSKPNTKPKAKPTGGPNRAGVAAAMARLGGR